jgi:hypothetical protein
MHRAAHKLATDGLIKKAATKIRSLMPWKKSKKSDNDVFHDLMTGIAPWTVNHVKGGIYTKKVHPETMMTMAAEAEGEKKKKIQKSNNKKRAPSRSISPQPKTKTNIKKNNNDDDDTNEKDRDLTIELDAYGKPRRALAIPGRGKVAVLYLTGKQADSMKSQHQKSSQSNSPKSQHILPNNNNNNNSSSKINTLTKHNNADDTNEKDRDNTKEQEVEQPSTQQTKKGWPLLRINIDEKDQDEKAIKEVGNHDQQKHQQRHQQFKSLERARSGDLSRMQKDTGGGWSAVSPRLQVQHA